MSDGAPQFKLLPTQKPHISFSELKTWSDCSYRHYLIHVKKLDSSRPSPILVFGKSIHAAVEKYLLTREVDFALCDQLLRDSWDEHRDIGEFTDAELLKSMDVARKILTEFPDFMETTFSGWQIVDAEHALYEPIGGRDHAFKGFIDAVINDVM